MEAGTKFFVSRQHEWGTWEHVVEVVYPTYEHASSDMLTVRFGRLGEGVEFADPRDAVEAAIAIRKAWHKTNPHFAIELRFGVTLGGMFATENTSAKDARERAEKCWEALPKCSRCDDLLPKEWVYVPDFCDDQKFCSQFCCDEAYTLEEPDETEEVADAG